jgi:hypothetical protein
MPLGHYNWNWSEARKKYTTWEKEILSGVLTIASQTRFLQNLLIVWMTDNEAATSFLKGEPPTQQKAEEYVCVFEPVQTEYRSCGRLQK